MARPTKFGKQPAAVELYRQQLTHLKAAQLIGVDVRHLRHALRGTVRPNPRVLRELPKLLGVGVEDLFTPEILEKPYSPHRIEWMEARRREGGAP